MLLVISPAKTFDDGTDARGALYTAPHLLDHSAQLINILKHQTVAELMTLMRISEPLARLNIDRYCRWSLPFTPDNAKPAVLAFSGDVYQGLNAHYLDFAQQAWLQQHTRILSGLYGLLFPFDLIQPYRLEMGTSLATERGKDLYAFWGNIITEKLNVQLANTPRPVLINLASNEYFKSVNSKQLQAALITPIFQDYHNKNYKVISFYAKRARGLMVRWAAQHTIDHPDALQHFDNEGYRFDASVSNGSNWVFRRKLPAQI